MNLITLFIIGVGTGLSGAMIPGPLFLFTVSEALRKDAMVGLRIAVGHIIIEACFVALIFLGFRNLLTSPGFMRLVSGMGGVALMVMGVILLYGAARMSLQVKEEIHFDYGSVIGGAFFSIISPGFLIWWSTIGFAVILKSLLHGFLGLTMVALGHWLADISWHWFVSGFVHQRKHYMEDKVYQNIIRLLAVGLTATGAYFCWGLSL